MTTAIPGPAAPAPSPEKPRVSPAVMRVVLIALLALIGFTLLRGVFSHHDTQYERIAFAMTAGLELNDLAAVEKFQNAETATQVTHAVVGRAADAFQPLGELQRVRETSEDATLRIHQFDATFAHGVVHETIRFDPDDKVVGFKYELPPPTN